MNNIYKNNYNNFNLLRLIFAILVIFSHSFELIEGNRNNEILTKIFHTISFGDLSVDGFFLLSGYLIVKSWNTNSNIWQFLKKRILRIYPGFIAASLVCAFIVGPLGSESNQYYLHFEISGFLKNLLLLNRPFIPSVFLGQPYSEVNGSMWSIFPEFRCYLAVMVLGVLGLIQKRNLWLVFTIIFYLLLIIQKLCYKFDYNIFFFSYKFLYLNLNTFFLTGGCFYLYRNRIQFDKIAASIAFIVLLIGTFSRFGADLVLGTAGGYLLFYFALKPTHTLVKFNKIPDLSYGVYLYGWPVQKLLLWFFPIFSPYILFFISVFGCLILGALSWYAIEKPLMKLKKEFWNFQWLL